MLERLPGLAELACEDQGACHDSDASDQGDQSVEHQCICAKSDVAGVDADREAQVDVGLVEEIIESSVEKSRASLLGIV